jgi:hypothetical protein
VTMASVDGQWQWPETDRSIEWWPNWPKGLHSDK